MADSKRKAKAPKDPMTSRTRRRKGVNKTYTAQRRRAKPRGHPESEAEECLSHMTWQLYFFETRISTFQNWPLGEDCACTPKHMAEAGFIHCPSEDEPDLAQCFFCFKELECWEPDDDPMLEHKKHSPSCAFIHIKKKMEDLTIIEFLELDKERTKNKIVKETFKKITEFEECAKEIWHEIKELTTSE